MKNIAIFWDFDNTFLSIQEKFGLKEDYITKLIESIQNLFKDDKVRIFRAYADFEKIRKVQSMIQKIKVTPKHVFSSNSGSDSRKNASDIELCLDALEIAMSNESIDYFVIITADKDMISLMHRLNYHGKTTHLIYLNEAISEDKLILTFCDKHHSIEELIDIEKPDIDNISEEKLKEGAEKAIEVVIEFNKRNQGKRDVYLGTPFYKQGMADKGYSGELAEKILKYCIEESILDSQEVGNNRNKITIKEMSKVTS
ncbi:MAG: NYN domain-containing protein [Bacillaceae bacterium]|nr:NYN domain-containing protein [Bacillaceae bacterium]